MARKPIGAKQVDALKHDAATRRNIPTAEMESFFRREDDVAPMPPKHYPRARPLAQGQTRTDEEVSVPEIIWNGAKITITDDQMAELAATGTLTLSDAQLVWRGKDKQDWSDLVVNVPPLYIQEKIHPKAIIDDLKRRTQAAKQSTSDAPDLFADFNGIEPDQRAEFYQHDQHWSNRMILGDSLQVMASLSERESLKGKVQCIYFDPPYGIKFNSNWQVSTQSRDVRDGKQSDISREPEQVKAFRDTWKDGIHSYLTYLRDRLAAMRDLLTESGSIFVQISDENVHRVRTVMDEVFGPDNFVSQIIFTKTAGATSEFLPGTYDIILYYCKNKKWLKFKPPYRRKVLAGSGGSAYSRVRFSDLTTRGLTANEKLEPEKLPPASRVYRIDNLTSQSVGREKGEGAASWFPVAFQGREIRPSLKVRWKTSESGMRNLLSAGRLEATAGGLYYVRYFDDFAVYAETDVWSDTGIAGFASDKQYVVETSAKVVERCILMATDPGDLVLDPTCGSGTTAYVAEQWGRRWITMDTSRVALTLARTRVMSARYPWYLLADSHEGRGKEAALTQSVPPETRVQNDIRQGFVYERVPHITLRSIANNPLINDIWEKWQPKLEELRLALNAALGTSWQEWEVPRELSDTHRARIAENEERDGFYCADDGPGSWLAYWWNARIERQLEIDDSIAARADVEYLYDRPYADKDRVRVAGPFTVESLSPHRVLPASADSLLADMDAAEGKRSPADADLAGQDFAGIVIDYLKTEGVKQQAKGDRITFDSIMPWPGNFIAATATFVEGGEGGVERRAAILIGPEYGTVGRQDLVAAAREAVDNRFDLLIACAFNFDAHSSELDNLGSLTILKARINPDMHMSDELKNTGRGNMFVVFGEPDIDVLDDGGKDIRIKINGVDVFDPNTGDVRSSDTKGIAAWFIDTDYDEESFFVRHAYFLGANDPYKSLKTALKAEIDEDAWATLYSDTSRPFERPAGGKIAVKVINHHGDEVMKVFGV